MYSAVIAVDFLVIALVFITIVIAQVLKHSVAAAISTNWRLIGLLAMLPMKANYIRGPYTSLMYLP